MERKKELWRKVKLEIQPYRTLSETGRLASQPIAQSQSVNDSIVQVLDDEVSSPTFVNFSSQNGQKNQREPLTFSFGQNILNEIEHLLKESVTQKSDGQILPVCIECDSFCIRGSEKMISGSAVREVMVKLGRFLQEVRGLFQDVKLGFKSYKSEMETMRMQCRGLMEVMLGGIEAKFNARKESLQQKIEKLTQENYFCTEKAKILQKKSNSLEAQLADLFQVSLSERKNYQNTNQRILELNEQLEAKARQISSLVEENLNLSTSLKKFMNLASSLTMNSNQSLSSRETDQSHQVLKQKINVQLSGEKSKVTERAIKSYRESSVHSVEQKDCLCEFKESLEFGTMNNEDYYLSSPVIHRYSKQNSKIFNDQSSNQRSPFQSPRQQIVETNQNQRNKLMGRRNSTTSVMPSRKYSWQLNTPEQESKNKNKILEKIQKLKEDIKTEIKDLKMNSL